MSVPLLVVLVSGKRKCGKDYLTSQLIDVLGEEKAAVIRISAPIKSHYAHVNGLDLNELMSENRYKETYRREMIVWSDEERAKDPACFCRAAVEKATPKPVWIVSDVRRKSDIAYFRATYGDRVKTVRIHADAAVRVNRGWRYTKGVDDVPSECDLDDYTAWDLQLPNNGQRDDQSVQSILTLIQAALR